MLTAVAPELIEIPEEPTFSRDWLADVVMVTAPDELPKISPEIDLPASEVGWLV